MRNKNIKKIIYFLFELSMLKRLKHEGWRLSGVENPPSIAEHSFRAAQIGYILAKLENYSKPEEICTMLLFHDIEECRTGDIHKIAERYITMKEKTVVKDQTKALGEIGKSIFNYWEKVKNKSSIAGKIAKDADLLEAAFTAHEYREKGYPKMDLWIKNYMKYLTTESAKEILKELIKTPDTWWWKDLKKY